MGETDSDCAVFSVPIDQFYKPLSEVPSPEDIQINRLNRDPEHLTSRLHELVPLARIIGFKLDSVTDEETVGSVPLLASSMNQNGTHQASVFYVMSDYIAGTAVYAGLPGTYNIGVHDRSPGQPIQLWLKSNSVCHLRPGTDLIQGRSALTDDRKADMRKKLIQKGRCEIQMHVDIYQRDELIAMAEPLIGVYLDNPRLPNFKIDYFQRESSKLSARLTAGLRHDETSQKFAGQQGRALAARFSEVAPQLPICIAARGTHLEQHLRQGANQYRQVVILGMGLDTRSLHFASVGQKWFGVDLRHMCKEYEAVMTTVEARPSVLTVVAADLRGRAWGELLTRTGFDGSKPTLFIVEGLSMYLHQAELFSLLEETRRLCASKDSRVWIDHVTPNFYSLNSPEVRSFLQAISRLGEPFVTGFTQVEAFDPRWKTVEQRSSAQVLGQESVTHPAYENHLVSLLAPC